MGKTTTCVYTPTTNDPDGVLQSVTTPGGRTFSYNDYDEPIAVTNTQYIGHFSCLYLLKAHE